MEMLQTGFIFSGCPVCAYVQISVELATFHEIAFADFTGAVIADIHFEHYFILICIVSQVRHWRKRGSLDYRETWVIGLDSVGILEVEVVRKGGRGRRK